METQNPFSKQQIPLEDPAQETDAARKAKRSVKLTSNKVVRVQTQLELFRIMHREGIGTPEIENFLNKQNYKLKSIESMEEGARKRIMRTIVKTKLTDLEKLEREALKENTKAVRRMKIKQNKTKLSNN